jgi:hypothetical protein
MESSSLYLEKLKEFVQFEFLIADEILPIFYVLCAIIIPVFFWYMLLWVIRRYALAIEIYKSGRYSFFFSFLFWVFRKIKFFRKKIDQKISWSAFTPTQKMKFLALYFIVVFFAELFLRLAFEYLIAYIHMHEWMKPPKML